MKICAIDDNGIYLSNYEGSEYTPYRKNEVRVNPPKGDNKFFKWDGNTNWIGLDEYPEPPVQIPQTLTPRQARLILLKYNLLDDIEALLTTDKALQIWWEYSLDADRNNEYLLQASQALGLSSEQLDDMFVEGALL
jgi:hypothetical protein